MTLTPEKLDELERALQVKLDAEKRLRANLTSKNLAALDAADAQLGVLLDDNAEELVRAARERDHQAAMTTNTMGRDQAGKAIRKRAMEGCPLARELLILRGMCSCQGDEESVDEAEDRYLELAALRYAVPALQAEVEALRAGVERVTCELMDATTRADKLAEALRLALDSHGVMLMTHPPQDAWNEGFDFAMKACGWQEGEDPSTEGLYVARDGKGNVEVGMWYAKTVTQPAGWTREFRDVDRDDIVAWMAIPDWKPKDEA